MLSIVVLEVSFHFPILPQAFAKVWNTFKTLYSWSTHLGSPYTPLSSFRFFETASLGDLVPENSFLGIISHLLSKMMVAGQKRVSMLVYSCKL